MNILLVNDDGIESIGIRILAEALCADHNVCIIAPEQERSAAGHSYSFSMPLRFKKYTKFDTDRFEAYSTSGTPCDCVLLGIQKFGKEGIDLIISGINAGANIGTDIPASGTVSAAQEGIIQGIPALAVSQEIHSLMSAEDYWKYYEFDAEYIHDFISGFDVRTLNDYILNINFPCIDKSEIKGEKVCPMGKSWNDFFYHAQDDYLGRTFYWVDVNRTPKEYNMIFSTDAKWLEEGYITYTPLGIDMTLYSKIDEVNGFISQETD